MKSILVLCTALLFASTLAARKSYNGYKVVQTKLLDEEDFGKLKKLTPMINVLSFWNHPAVGHTTDIMVSATYSKLLIDILQNLNLEPKIVIEDVGKIEQSERDEIEKSQASEILNPVTFGRYMTLVEIQLYLKYLATAYPKLATLKEIGRTSEGRPLQMLKISNGSGKKAVFIDAGIHAREWLTIPVALKIAFELIENYAANKELVDMVDWYILPVANPDGYVYSWTTDRYWRKNRNMNADSDCIGVNSNGNFDYFFGEQKLTSPCADNWPGTKPFSEPESIAMANFMLLKRNLKLYLAIHSYGGFLVYPYGHTTQLPPSYQELNATAVEAVTALESVYGTKYKVGSMANTLYHAYGTGRDFAYGVAGIPLSYTLEVPGYGAGFSPPLAVIKPAVEESWEAIKVLATRAASV